MGVLNIDVGRYLNVYYMEEGVYDRIVYSGVSSVHRHEG